MVAETYTCLAVGECLGSVMPHASFCKVDPSREIRVGDLVVVAFRETGAFSALVDSAGDAGQRGVVKIYLGRDETDAGETVHMVGALYPAAVLSVPDREIHAMHVVVASTRDREPSLAEMEADRRVWDLLTPFFRDQGPTPPVGPSWRPYGLDEVGDILAAFSGGMAEPMATFSLGVLETASGPTIGTAADLIQLLGKSRDALAGKVTGEEAKAPYADALNLALQNNPVFYANLFYIRPALDFLFLDSLREAVSPGYMKRQTKRRLKDYGQKRPFKSLDPFGKRGKR